MKISRFSEEQIMAILKQQEADHHPREDTFLAPTLPLAVERLVRTVGIGSVSPAQPIAVDEDNPAQDAPVIDPWPAVRLREERGELGHLLVGQPVKVAHVTAPFSGRK